MARYLIGLMICLSNVGFGQVFKNVSISPGMNFTQLEWAYRFSSTSQVEERKGTERGVGVNVYLTADVIDKKNWAMNTSVGWIRKKGLFTESANWSNTRVPYKLDYISWINSAKAKISAGDRLNFYISAGPRVEYLLTNSDEIPVFAPNDDSFYYYHGEEDIRKFHFGASTALGVSWEFEKMSLQLTGWKNINFNPVMSAHGQRADGLGDEGFYLKMRDDTFGINLRLILKRLTS